jgi:hypothetical protein
VLSAPSIFRSPPGYLQAAGTHILTGRDFTWHDDAKSPKVAIVNERFARAMFGSTSALGLRFTMADMVPREIVGVVENGKYDSLTESPWAAMFFPLDQFPDSDTSLVVRSQLPPGQLIPELKRALAQVDPTRPLHFIPGPTHSHSSYFPLESRPQRSV